MSGTGMDPLPFIKLRPAIRRLAAATGSTVSGVFSCAYEARCGGVTMKRLTRDGQILVATVDLP